MSVDLQTQLTAVNARLALAEARLDEMLDCVQMTYTVDGETFKANEYQEMLIKLIDRLTRKRDLLCRAIGGGGFKKSQGFA